MGFEAKITSKGQITIPAALRARLNARTGDRLRFEVAEDGSVSVEKVSISIEDLRGILKPPGGPPSIEDIVAAVRAVRGGGDKGDGDEAP